MPNATTTGTQVVTTRPLAPELAFRTACLDPDSPHAALVARYLSLARLRTLLRAVIMEAVAAGSRGTSVKRLYEELVELGLVVPLPVTSVGSATDAPHWLVLRGRSGLTHDPLQLLCSVSEDAIVSHRSALVFHALTLTPDSRHFVTLPASRPKRTVISARTERDSPDEPSTRATHATRRGPPIGTSLFGLDGNEYRFRRVFEDLVFGVKRVRVDELEYIRVFDRERTLLYTLTDPQCNGDVRVVLDAWERAADQLRPERLLSYLRRLNQPMLWRRVGAITERLAMDDITEAAGLAVADLPAVDDPPMLVRGTAAGHRSTRWGLMVPW